MSKAKLIGLTLAATAAIAFSTAPITSALAGAHAGKIACMGANSCKGMSDCKTAKNACKGKNKCKASGIKITKSKKECKKMQDAAK